MAQANEQTIKAVKKTCSICHGRGKTEYCVNPDNGHLDTQMNNLRYEWGECPVCGGTGETVSVSRSQPNGEAT